MSTLQQLQAEITARMRRGDAFETVEDEVIDRSALPEAEKAALWLYGWSFVPWQRQRREALGHIAALLDSPPPPAAALLACQQSAARAVGQLHLAASEAQCPRPVRPRRHHTRVQARTAPR